MKRGGAGFSVIAFFLLGTNNSRRKKVLPISIFSIFHFCYNKANKSIHSPLYILFVFLFINFSIIFKQCFVATYCRTSFRCSQKHMMRQDFAPCANFVASIMPCRNNSGKISPKFLASGKSRCTFAVANKRINKIIISKIKTQVPEGH